MEYDREERIWKQIQNEFSNTSTTAGGRGSNLIFAFKIYFGK